jgi:hypothetical protein
VLTWEDLFSTVGFVPQCTTNLTTPSWVSLTNAPTATSGLKTVVVPFAQGRAYFRLQQF